VATASSDKKVKIWNPMDCKCMAEFDDEEEINFLAKRTDTSFYFITKKKVKVCDFMSRSIEEMFSDFFNITAVAKICQQDKMIAVGLNGGVIKCLIDGQTTARLSHHGAEVTAIHSYGSYLFSACTDNLLVVYDMTKFKILKEIELEKYGTIKSIVALSQNLIAIGEEVNGISIIDYTTGVMTFTPIDMKNVTSISPMLSTSIGEVYFAAAQEDGVLKMWKLEGENGEVRVVKTQKKHKEQVNQFGVFASGDFVTVSDDKSLKIWAQSSGGCCQLF
jgi:WD40 repeat protein